MNTITILGIVCFFLGVGLHFLAEVLYASKIQRYLEHRGVSPAFFGFSGSGHRDYLKAKKITKQEKRTPNFLKQYERIEIVAMVFFVTGISLVLIKEIIKAKT